MQSTTGSKRRATSPLAPDEVPKKQKTTLTSPITSAADVFEFESPKTVKSDGTINADIVNANDTKTDHVTDVVDMDLDDANVKDSAETTKPARKTKLPPIKECFVPWKPTVALPAPSDFWGIKPKTGDACPHPDQPSARETNGATNPPMWEDRKFRFKRGSRYTKYFGPIEPGDSANGPDVDQENLLVVQLIDMRARSTKDPTPRRLPTTYAFEHGKPKDWNNMQAVKCLNDRRGQALDRVCCDAPWSKIERQYLSQIINEHPDASIWKWTELYNDRFMDDDFATSSGFTFVEKSEGRTVESVRHEYVTYNVAYNNGAPPENIRWRTDKSVTGKAIAAAGKFEMTFGLPDKKLEKQWDEANESNGDEDVAVQNGVNGTPQPPKKKAKTPAKKPAPKKRAAKKSKAVVEELNARGELQAEAAARMAEQPKLSDDEEALLELAGVYHPEEIRNSPPHSLPSDPSLPFDLYGPDSPLTDLSSGPPSPIASRPSIPTPDDDADAAAAATVIDELVGGYVAELVEQVVAHADEQKHAKVQTQDAAPTPETANIETEVKVQIAVEVI